jgi:L-ribulokinase
MVGLEAGQSAFGDLYAWFKRLVNGPAIQVIKQSEHLDAATRERLLAELEDKSLIAMSAAAAKLAPGTSGVTALDWVNGRRTPDADQTVSGAITGLKMGSTSAEVFRALVEATAFGARAIIERFRAEGVAVDSVVAIGGISKKSDFVMQTCADVWNCPIDVLESEQSCALGAAIFAATVGGAHPDVASAQQAMGSSVSQTYQPNEQAAAIFDELYKQYQALGQYVEAAKS